MKNKILAIFVVGAVSLFVNMGIVVAFENFNDVNTAHPNYTAIMDLRDRGVIDGYPDGTFKPEQTVNRVEALKIILNAAGVDSSTAGRVANFSDIDQTQWYAPFLNKAYDLGVVEGYVDGTFKPTQTVNLVENLKILLGAYKVDLSEVTVTENLFADAFADQWYAKYVQYAKDKKLIEGDSDNKVYPGQGMTRAKLAETSYRFIQVTENNLDYFGQVKAPVSDEIIVAPPGGRDDTLQINISASGFSVKDLLVPVGGAVRWTNTDSVKHNVTNTGFSSPDLATGDSYVHVFNKEGTFNYFCSLHPSLTGKITVKPAYMVPTI